MLNPPRALDEERGVQNEKNITMKTIYDWVSDTKESRSSHTPNYMDKPDFYIYGGQTNNAGFGTGQRWNQWARKAQYGPEVHGNDIEIIRQDKKFLSQSKVDAEEQLHINTLRKVARDATSVGVHVVCCNRNNAHKATYEAGTIDKKLYNQVMKKVGAWKLWKSYLKSLRKYAATAKKEKGERGEMYKGYETELGKIIKDLNFS